jgi:hypothetical protein
MIYDPKTAFGRPDLIAQAKQLAEREELKKHTVSPVFCQRHTWVDGSSKCPFCNYENDFELDDEAFDFDQHCKNCNKNYIVELD